MAATASMEALNQATQVERDRQDNELYENGFVLALDRLFRLPAILPPKTKSISGSGVSSLAWAGARGIPGRLLLLSDVRCRQLCWNWLITPSALVFA
jgi:hypothetical protein